jgi:phosphatidylglycerol:prolipoprotein diacylglycerol transferase
MAGGHLLNVFGAWASYRTQPAAILDLLAGGSSIFGALAFGIGAGVLCLRWQGLRVRAFLDAAAPAMALGEAMTRVGCFLSGCCFGVPTRGPLGVAFPRGSYAWAAQVAAGLISPGSETSLPVHSTQLYSAAASALLFAVLLRTVWRARAFPGAAFCASLFGYGLQRLVVGWWRGDGALYPWEVSPALSILTIMLAGALWALWRPQTGGAAAGELDSAHREGRHHAFPAEPAVPQP